MRIALYQPDIPHNTGALLRLGACLGVGIDIIEPCGFFMDDRRLRRVGMDYVALADMVRYASWNAYRMERGPGRLVLLTTKGVAAHTDFAFRADDTLLLGRESQGVPEDVHAQVDERIRIPMRPHARSFNLAMAAALVVGEALRQTDGYPDS